MNELRLTRTPGILVAGDSGLVSVVGSNCRS